MIYVVSMRGYSFLPLLAIILLGFWLPVQGAGEEPVSSRESSAHEEAPDTTSVKDLDELVVAKSLIEQEGNRDIITVSESLRKGAKDAGELLGRLPGVHYNPITTDLLYKGSGNVLILVNGVEKDPSYIKRLNPGRFDKITITNNPTGMYSGYDAVIDLHVRPLYTGYEGVALAEVSLSPEGNNGKGRPVDRTRDAGQFTYTRERFNLDFNTSYNYTQTGLGDYFEKRYPLNGIIERTLADRDDEPNRFERKSNYSASLAADYDISGQHSVSAQFTISPSSTRNSSHYNLERRNLGAGTSEMISEDISNSVHGRLDMSGGVWYRGSAGSWNLMANASYTDIGFRTDHTISTSSGYHLDDARKVSANYWTARADAGRYVHPKWYLTLSEGIVVSRYEECRQESGEKLSESNDIRNTFEASIGWYGSNIAYFSVNAGFSFFRNNYNGLHSTHISPRAGFQGLWKPSEKAYFRFDYRMSSQPPSLNAIQDYGQFTDSLIYTAGNPRLKPSLVHNVSLSGTFFQKLTFSASYIYTTDDIFYLYNPAEGYLPSGAYSPYACLRPFNGSTGYWKLNLSYSDKFGPHWMVSANVGVMGRRCTMGSESNRRVLPTAEWYAMYQTLGNTLQVYLSGSLRGNMAIGPQQDLWSMTDGYSLCVSKTFMHNRIQCLVLWHVPLHFTSGEDHGGIDSKSYVYNYNNNNQFRDNNNLMFTLVYRFKGGESVRKYNRQSTSVNI